MCAYESIIFIIVGYPNILFQKHDLSLNLPACYSHIERLPNLSKLTLERILSCGPESCSGFLAVGLSLGTSLLQQTAGRPLRPNQIDAKKRSKNRQSPTAFYGCLTVMPCNFVSFSTYKLGPDSPIFDLFRHVALQWPTSPMQTSTITNPSPLASITSGYRDSGQGREDQVKGQT